MTACLETVTAVIHSNHAYYDHVCINDKILVTSTHVYFLYSHSVFECLCTACIAESDASLDTINLRFVASCHKRAVVYMNRFSVLRHKRSQIKERICLFCKMPANTKQITNIYDMLLDEDF